jgi:hypothetical protein
MAGRPSLRKLLKEVVQMKEIIPEGTWNIRSKDREIDMGSANSMDITISSSFKQV